MWPVSELLLVSSQRFISCLGSQEYLARDSAIGKASPGNHTYRLARTQRVKALATTPSTAVESCICGHEMRVRLQHLARPKP